VPKSEISFFRYPVYSTSYNSYILADYLKCCRIEWEIFANRVLMTVSDNGLNHWRPRGG